MSSVVEKFFCEYVSNLLISSYKIDLYYYQNGLINKNINLNKKINLLGIKSKNIFINFFLKIYFFISTLFNLHFK